MKRQIMMIHFVLSSGQAGGGSKSMAKIEVALRSPKQLHA
jgi:hypothetical protein